MARAGMVKRGDEDWLPRMPNRRRALIAVKAITYLPSADAAGEQAC